MRKFIGFMLFFTVSALAWGTDSGEAAAAYDDVDESFWAAEEIAYLNEKEVIAGDGSFAPNREVTRHQAAGMLAEALDLNLEDAPDSAFADVDNDTPHHRAIAAMAAEDILQGSDGAFRPGEAVTRSQMAVLLTRAFELERSEQPYYVDTGSSHWAFEEISAVTDHGIASGKEDRRSFHPNEATTRAQFSVFLTRAMKEEERLQRPVSIEKQVQKLPAPDSSLNIQEAEEQDVLRFVQEAEKWLIEVISIPVSEKIWTMNEEEKQEMFSHLGSLFSVEVIETYFDRFYEPTGEIYTFQEGETPMIPENYDESSVQVEPRGSGRTTIDMSVTINEPRITIAHESILNKEDSVFEQFTTESD